MFIGQFERATKWHHKKFKIADILRMRMQGIFDLLEI